MTSLLLPVLILLPLICGALTCVFGNRGPRLASLVCLLVSGLVLVGSIGLLSQVSLSSRTNLSDGLIQPRLIYAPESMNLSLPVAIQGHPIAWRLHLGADSLSASMVFLTAIVTLAVLLTARNQITKRPELYAGLILITQGLLIGVFLAMDLLLFYICFEAVLLPVILLINLWGDSKEALKASRKFFLFTLAGSIPMVVGLVGLVVQSASEERPSTVLMTELSRSAYASQLKILHEPVASHENAILKAEEALEVSHQVAISQLVILFTLLLGFGIKMAVLPLHSWLPTTYVAAHPNTTALIAAVMSKLGVYGLLRIVIPLTPLALVSYVQLIIGALGAIAIVYGGIIALGQTDLRRLLAYSSLSHLGFVTLGLMALNREGLSGASIQMLNHGLITAAMFLLVASIEERCGRLALNDESRGLAAVYPRLGFLMVFFTLAAAGLPGLNSFVGELLAMAGMIRVSIPLTAMAVVGTVLGAWYSLRVLQYLMFGSDGQSTIQGKSSVDIGRWELTALAPIATLCLAIGVCPCTAIDFMRSDISNLSEGIEPVVKAMRPNVDSSMLYDKVSIND